MRPRESSIFSEGQTSSHPLLAELSKGSRPSIRPTDRAPVPSRQFANVCARMVDGRDLDGPHTRGVSTGDREHFKLENTATKSS